MLRYGSLSKQQEICFPSCSWYIFSDLVCRFLLPLITMDIDYGSICDDDDNVALWSNLERIYAHSEGEFMLVNHKQNHACGKACVIHGAILPTLCSVAEIASSFDMICFELFRESSVTQKQNPLGYFIFQTMTSVCKFSLQLFYAHVLHCVCPFASILLEHNASQVLPLMELLEEFGLLGCKPVSTQMELNLKLSQDIGDFLLDVSSYHLLDVVSSECSKNRLIMVYCMCTLTRFGLFVKTEACWFEALLIFVGISSKWLDIHVRIGSQSCVSRHGKLTMIIVDWILQRRHILLRHLSPAQGYEVIKSLYKEEAKPVAVTNDDFTLLLHGDGSFVGQEAVDDSVRLITFIFGSLTRPPETHCVFSFKPWIFMSIDTSIFEKVMEDTH